MSRNKYDISFLSHICGHIGRIQTVQIIPVEAGASVELNLDGIARLAPNRKEIVSECQVDICAFFVPHRIVYGQQWIDVVKQGVDATMPFTGIAIGAGFQTAPYLTLTSTGATINRSVLEGYNRIYYNYYSVPNYAGNPDAPPALVNDFTWFPTTSPGAANCRNYGRLAARLPHVLNGGNMTDTNTAVGDGWEAQDLESNDWLVPVTAGTFDIRDLAQIQSRYRSEAENAWFRHFFQDVMEGKFGTNVGPDTDPENLRPHFLGRSTSMMSGTDIDGMDDATIGSFQGKTLERVSFDMPRKFFNEHGNIFILALLRYPLVHTREAHPLLQVANWTYDDIMAEPVRYANAKPIQFDPGAWINGGVSYVPTAPYQQPYGQHYRFMPNRVHPNYQAIPGYPFSNWNGAVFDSWLYYQDNEYRDTFQTNQIGQWQISARVKTFKYSNIPGVDASIFAGA